ATIAAIPPMSSSASTAPAISLIAALMKERAATPRAPRGGVPLLARGLDRWLELRHVDGLDAAALHHRPRHAHRLPGHGLEAVVRIGVVVVEREQVERAAAREQAHRHALVDALRGARHVFFAAGAVAEVAAGVNDLTGN